MSNIKGFFVDKLPNHYVDIWNKGLDENRADRAGADPGKPVDDASLAPVAETTGNSRLRFHTPMPATELVLGKPGDFGYPGISMRAENMLFVDIAGRTRYQHHSPVTVVASKQWWQYSMKDMTLATDANAVFATRRRFILAAGGGYGAWPLSGASQLGNALPDEAWASTDVNEILDPAHWGMRSYDADLEELDEEHQKRFGYRVPVGPPKVPVAVSKAAARLEMLMGGDIPTPTANSPAFERMLDMKRISLLNVLDKVSRIADRVGRWAGRNDTIPLLGPVFFAKKKAFENADWALKELFTAPQVGTSGQNLQKQWSDSHDFWGFYDHVVPAFKDVLAKFKRLKLAAKELVLALCDILGLVAPNRSALGLLGKDGITCVTHEDMFAWAPKGFTFVSTKNADDYPMDAFARLEKAARKAEQYLRDKIGHGAVGGVISNILFGKENEKIEHEPSFRVLSGGQIELRSEDDVRVSGWGDDSRVRVEATAAAELAAIGPVGVSSRASTVEVMGSKVALGIPAIADAKAAAKLALTLEAAIVARDTARTAWAAACDELIAARKKRDAKAARIDKTEAQLDRAIQRAAGAPLPSRIAKVTQLQARLAAQELQLIPLVAAVDAAKVAVTTTQRAFSTARRAATKATKAAAASCSKSAIAKALDWKPEEQALTEKLSAIATRDVALYAGKEARIGSGQSIVLEADNLLTMQKAKISVDSEIELSVGLFTITVKKNKILISNGVTDVVTVDAQGAVIDSGGASIKVTAGQVAISAATKAQISAAGRILLG